MTALSAWRDGVRRVNGAPMVLLGMYAAHAVRGAPAVDRASRHDRRPPRRQRHGRDGGVWHELRLVAGILGAGNGPRHHIRPVDHRIRRCPRQPQRAPRQPADGRDDRRCHGGVARHLVVPQWRRARSLRADAAHARAGILRRVRHAFLAVPPSRAPRAGSSTGRSSGSCTRGSSTMSIRGRRTT